MEASELSLGTSQRAKRLPENPQGFRPALVCCLWRSQRRSNAIKRHKRRELRADGDPLTRGPAYQFDFRTRVSLRLRILGNGNLGQALVTVAGCSRGFFS